MGMHFEPIFSLCFISLNPSPFSNIPFLPILLISISTCIRSDLTQYECCFLIVHTVIKQCHARTTVHKC
jgi:hypothetical protein